MKLDRVKVAFGAASVVLFGVLVACGGDDDDDIVPGTSSSGGSSGGDASVSSSSSSGGSSGASSGGSSSGGANSCQPAYGCYKNTFTQAAVPGNIYCGTALDNTSYSRTAAPDGGGSDAGPVVDPQCSDDGSNASTCLSKTKCTYTAENGGVLGARTSTSQSQVDGDTTTSTTSTTYGDAGAPCVTTYKSEKVDDSFCELDAATL